MSDFGWFYLGLFVGIIICGLVLTFVEARWQFISKGRRR